MSTVQTAEDQSPATPLKSAAEIAARQSPRLPQSNPGTLADGSPFPTDWPALHSLIQEFKAAPIPSDPAQAALHEARFEELRRRGAIAQRGIVAPVTTSNQQSQSIQARLTGKASRLQRAGAIASFLEKPAPTTAPLSEYDLKTEPKARLLAEPEVQSKLWECRRLLASAELFQLANFDLAFPAERIAEIRHEIATANSLQGVRDLMAELSTLSDAGTKRDVSVISNRLIENELRPALAAVAELIQFCRDLLQKWQAAAIQREDEFGKSHGMPPTRTPLSERFAAALKQLPNVSRDLAWFGVSDIAGN